MTAALFMSLAGYMHSVFIGTVSIFYVILLLQSFYGSGMGFVYGIDNLGKFIGPAGLALIAGSSNYVKPAATLDALIPGFNTSPFGTSSVPLPSGLLALKRAAVRSAR